MDRKLTPRGTLTSLPSYFGIACIGFSLAHVVARVVLQPRARNAP